MGDSQTAFDFDEDIDRSVVPALKTHPVVVGEGGKYLFAAGVADMDFKVAPPVMAALRQRLEHGVFGYETLPDGLIPALMEWQYKRHGWKVRGDHVLRAPNILNGLAIAASLFSKKGDGIIVQPPVFFDFYDIIKENERNLAINPLKLRNGHYEVDFQGLEILASDSRNKILFLCNPHNPVGRVWKRDELMKVDEICRRNNILVIADEIHADIIFPGHRYIPFASLGSACSDNTITLISPAKSFNIAGCCSSFTVITNDERRRRFQEENSRLTANKNNAFASVAMEAAYTKGEPWLNSVIDYLNCNLDIVRSYLTETQMIKLIEPEGTFLVWLDFRELNYTTEQLTAFLRNKAGWAITRGAAFGKEGIGFARLNIACPKSRLETALKSIVTAVNSK